MREAVEEGVLADEVPVAHPGGAEVADGAVVGEGSGGGELFGDAVGEGVGLRDGEERSAGADGVEDAGLEMAECDDLGLFAGLELCGRASWVAAASRPVVSPTLAVGERYAR